MAAQVQRVKAGAPGGRLATAFFGEGSALRDALAAPARPDAARAWTHKPGQAHSWLHDPAAAPAALAAIPPDLQMGEEGMAGMRPGLRGQASEAYKALSPTMWAWATVGQAAVERAALAGKTAGQPAPCRRRAAAELEAASGATGPCLLLLAAAHPARAFLEARPSGRPLQQASLYCPASWTGYRPSHPARVGQHRHPMVRAQRWRRPRLLPY